MLLPSPQDLPMLEVVRYLLYTMSITPHMDLLLRLAEKMMQPTCVITMVIKHMLMPMHMLRMQRKTQPFILTQLRQLPSGI